MFARTRIARLRGVVAFFLGTVMCATTACSIDALLEANVPVDVHLSMAVQATELPANPGTTPTVDASITRLGDYHGDVTFSITGLPESIKGEVGAPTTSGQVTTATITFRVGTDAPIGEYLVTIHGTGGNGVSAAQVVLKVTPVPGVALTLSQPSLTIIRGGIAPLNVTIVRNSAPNPVTLSLSGAQGITAVADSTPVAGSSAALTIAVASSVAPGTYPMMVHATSSGIADRDVPLSVVVSADPLQLIAPNVVALQASVVSADVIVNRTNSSDPVVFSAEALPVGVTATFTGGDASSATARMTFNVSARAPVGPSIITLRGRGNGNEDASVVFVLTIGASNVALTLVPQNVSVLQGSSAASTLTLLRTSFAGAVQVQFANVPPGLNVSVADAPVTGNVTFVTVTADVGFSPGVYQLTVRAVPAASNGGTGPALDPASSTLTITVLEAPPGIGNVLLDWSACSTPDWVAAQDGTGAWTPLVGAQGRFRFAINSGRGGFAYTDGNKQLVVRFGTASELSAATVNLCPAPDPAVHDVLGSAVHNGLTELFTWRLGGGVGTSAQLRPNFTISGVRDGVHDLVGWGTSVIFGLRMHLTRDINALSGESVGTVGLVGFNSFSPLNTTINITGFSSELASYTVSYATRATCDVNELYQNVFVGNFSGTLPASYYGVPANLQRPDDYHMLDVTAINGNTRRTLSTSFHAITNGRSFPLPSVLSPTVTTIDGSYQRLRLFFGQSIATSYNDMVTLRYSDAVHAVTLSASVAALGSGTPILDMPDLGGVSGFPVSASMPKGANGNWTVTVTGSNGQALCSDDSRRWSFNRNGAF